MQSTVFGIVMFQTPGLKLFELSVSPNFKISARRSTNYTPDGRGDVLDIAVYQNVSEVTVIDIQYSDHLSMFSIVDLVRTREASDPVEKLTDWELFQSLASEFVSPNI
jgi:hypothetical protein